MTTDLRDLTQRDARDWYPCDYIDEIMPKPQSSPDGWIVVGPDGAPALLGCEPDDEPRPLTDGERVGFIYCDTFGSANLVIREDGSWMVSSPMPTEARQVCALGGWQADTLATSVEECVKLIKELIGDEAVELDLSYYTYSDTIAFRFDAATRSFKLAGPLQ